MRCYTCGLVNCPCGCEGDPAYCICTIYRHNPFEVCPVCGIADCPCGCEDDPNLCTCARRDEKDIAKDMQVEGYTSVIIDPTGQLRPHYVRDGAEGWEYLKTHEGRSFKNYGIDEFQYQNNPACVRCGLDDCPCGCEGDPVLCSCQRFPPWQKWGTREPYW